MEACVLFCGVSSLRRCKVTDWMAHLQIYAPFLRHFLSKNKHCNLLLTRALSKIATKSTGKSESERGTRDFDVRIIPVG